MNGWEIFAGYLLSMAIGIAIGIRIPSPFRRDE